MLKKMKLVLLGAVTAVVAAYAFKAVAYPAYAYEVFYYADANRTQLIGNKIVKCTQPYTVMWGSTSQYQVVNREGACYPGSIPKY